jgi:hypothetical protein
MVELHFVLDINDGWPPVAIEGLLCSAVEGGFRVEAPPLFIKKLSVGDIISVSQDSAGNVFSWVHVEKSNRTTIWLLRIAKTDSIDGVLQKLSSLKCQSVQLPQYGCYSIDIPEECSIANVDACLEELDKSCIAIAYPSFRHEG